MYFLSWLYSLKDPTWMISWGYGNRDNWGHDITVDANDNLYVVGDTESYGAGDEDIIVLKFDDKGNILWSTTWGGNKLDNGYAIISDSFDNYYITGRTQSYGQGNDDIILLKYNKDGFLVFNKTWGGTRSDIGYDLIIDQNENIYITGETWKAGNLYGDIVLIKFNSTGSEVWNVTWGGEYTQESYGIAQDSNEDIYIVGYSTGYSELGTTELVVLKYSSSGNLIWNLTWSPYFETFGRDIVIDSNDNLYIVGNIQQSGSLSQEGVVLKLTKMRDILWNKTFSGGVYDIKITSDQSIYLLGGKSMGFTRRSIILYQIDNNGNQKNQYTHYVEYGYYAYGENIIFDSKNNFYIIGYYHTLDNGKNSLLFIKNPAPSLNLPLIISISIGILIFLQMQFSYFTFRKNTRIFLTLEKLDESISAPLPPEIKSMTSSKEISLLGKNLEHSSDNFQIVFISGIILPIIFGIMTFLISSWSITDISLEIYLFFPLLMFIFIIISLYFLIRPLSIKERFLAITNRDVFYKNYNKQNVFVKSLSISQIKIVIFKKKRFKRDKDLGSILFIPNEKDNESLKILVEKVPQFSLIQNKIESIIYHHNDIEGRLNELQTKLKVIIPHELRISKELIRELIRFSSIYLIGVIVAITCYILFGILTLNLIENEIDWIDLIIEFFLIISIFLFFFLIQIIIRIFYSIKSILHQNRKLIIRGNNIECCSSKYSLVLPFDPAFSINFSWTKKLYSRKANWFNATHFVIVSPSIKKKIRFGPVDNFPEYLEFLYCYHLTWKAKNNFLIPETDILK